MSNKDEENDVEMNSNDESEEEEDEDEDAQVQQQLGELNERLEVSQGQDYEAHVAKVDLLRSAGELDQLREAREAFNKAGFIFWTTIKWAVLLHHFHTYVANHHS